MIEVVETNLKGVLLIKPTYFKDHRGYYLEIYNQRLYKEKGIDVGFVEDDVSIATKGVLKGIHGDSITWKLISCLHGEFYLVVINFDKDSNDFGKWQSFVLSENNKYQVLVPPKHGNGHLCLSEKSIFHYKQSAYYGSAKQFTILWNDPKFNIPWPIKDPILSERDRNARPFEESV
ncbi:MAG: dTDP-4-dehydrorhamnose 3,5-epimerase family protein [Candidatus Omnitrophica bacterium]|nr:dTDP-4-dehydrorhamnose 3,5-epimerase family protein [Candidatus Omnitrophota bacterium]